MLEFETMSGPERPKHSSRNGLVASQNGAIRYGGLIELQRLNVFPADIRVDRKADLGNSTASGHRITDRSPASKWQTTILNTHALYVSVMEARGATQEAIERQHLIFSQSLTRFHNAREVAGLVFSDKQSLDKTATMIKGTLVDSLLASLDAMVKNSFDEDLYVLIRLQASPDRIRILKSTFDRSNREQRVSVIVGMQNEVKFALVNSFPRLMKLAETLDLPLRYRVLLIEFNKADQAGKSKISKELLTKIDTHVHSRLTAEQITLRSLLIDQGLDFGSAEIQALTTVPIHAIGQLEGIEVNVLKAKDLVDLKLAERFFDNVALWAKMNDAREDIATAQRRKYDQAGPTEKKKLARNVYKRVLRRLRHLNRAHLKAYEKVLKDGGTDGQIIEERVRQREREIANSSTARQLELSLSLQPQGSLGSIVASKVPPIRFD